MQINQLPYIEIPNYNIRLLIDTGSHASLLRPSIAETHFPNLIEPYVSTLHTCAGSRKATSKAKIPLFLCFGITDSIEFILYPFHEYFDGILGIKDIRKLKLGIDIENERLINQYLEIPFQYRRDFDHYVIEIPPKTIQKTTLRTELPNNTTWTMPYYRDNEIEIQPTLVSIVDNTYTLDILNHTNKTLTLECNTKNNLPLESIDLNNFEIFNFETKHHTNKKQFSEHEKVNFENLIRHQHLNQEERVQLFKLIKNYSQVLHKPGDKLTFSNKVKHVINTTDELPVHTKSYRYPYVHKEEVNKQVNQMLEDGIIQPSNSPWSSPIWIVPKKMDASGQKKWRLVVDYRKLNEKTVDDRYPLPNITDILDKLGRCQYFTTLDLASGFHQIEMDPNSISKTAFNVEHGHYEYTRMPFGLKNAPSTFQRAMDNVLRGLQGKICLVYMDDIIIYSTSLQEHLDSLKQVFDRLISYNMKIQLDKSEFLQKTVEFLGHVVTPEGIKPNPKKLQAIKNFKIPNTPKEIKSFLGLVGYYRKFIKNFAKITKPLTNCLKKNVKIIHDKPFLISFNLCKNILMNDPILQHPDFEKPFILTTDASDYAIGAILSQGSIGTDLPIAEIC